MSFQSEWCSYHPTSTDPVIPGCRCTKLEEEGVTFVDPEPMEGIDLFLGRTVLVEAIALLHNLTPADVKDALENYTPPGDVEPKKPRRKKTES